MSNVYTLEVRRGKSYRKMYEGRYVQVLKRLPSIYSPYRIKRDGEIISKGNF